MSLFGSFVEWQRNDGRGEEVMRLSSGEPAYYSRDLFAPDHLELDVLRWMRSEAPPTRDVGGQARRPG